MMSGNEIIEALTKHFRKHKTQAKEVVFIISINGERVEFTPSTSRPPTLTAHGTAIELNRVIR